MIDPRRQAVIEEAKTWLKTPYHHEAEKRGAGVDCGKLLIAVYSAVGVIPHVTVERYPAQFMLHRNREWYLEIVSEHSVEFAGPPRPGDVAMFKFGRLYAHGAIVVEWPLLIHAWAARREVCWGDGLREPSLVNGKARFFSPYSDHHD